MVAGDRTGLDQRGALPVLAEPFVILQRGGGRHGDVGRAGIGAEPQVGAENVPVGGALVENVDKPLGQADETLGRLLPGREPDALVVIEHDQIDIARIVELATAELAHAEDDPAAVLFRIGGVCRAELPGGGGFRQDQAHRRPEGGLGKIAECGGHGLDVPDAAEVGEPREERNLLPRIPEGRHQFGLVRAPPGLCRGCDDFGEPFRRISGKDRNEAANIVDNQRAKEGRAVENAGNEPAYLRPTSEDRRETLICGGTQRQLLQLLQSRLHPARRD